MLWRRRHLRNVIDIISLCAACHCVQTKKRTAGRLVLIAFENILAIDCNLQFTKFRIVAIQFSFQQFIAAIQTLGNKSEKFVPIDTMASRWCYSLLSINSSINQFLTENRDVHNRRTINHGPGPVQHHKSWINFQIIKRANRLNRTNQMRMRSVKFKELLGDMYRSKSSPWTAVSFVVTDMWSNTWNLSDFGYHCVRMTIANALA